MSELASMKFGSLSSKRLQVGIYPNAPRQPARNVMFAKAPAVEKTFEMNDLRELASSAGDTAEYCALRRACGGNVRLMDALSSILHTADSLVGDISIKEGFSTEVTVRLNPPFSEDIRNQLHQVGFVDVPSK